MTERFKRGCQLDQDSREPLLRRSMQRRQRNIHCFNLAATSSFGVPVGDIPSAVDHPRSIARWGLPTWIITRRPVRGFQCCAEEARLERPWDRRMRCELTTARVHRKLNRIP